ncbi:MAG: TIGR03084 family metal-binding protein [Pseudomonadota bacterium]
MEQAEDFLAESIALHTLVSEAGAARMGTPTLFKSWTINEIIRHLHFWNLMAAFQITDQNRLKDILKTVTANMRALRGIESKYLDGLSDAPLLAAWCDGFHDTADQFSAVDPKRRLQWAGPSMSARSSITARLMETWAHGQAIYDVLGVHRINTDRIKNIVILGVNTFHWTYQARGEKPPGPMPFLQLTAPSGQEWVYGEDNDVERIEGPAEAFCQVVTQTRNIADTPLRVEGAIASDWMSKAQCFAGPPETPPSVGARYTKIR